MAPTAGQLVGFGYVVESASGWWAGIRPSPPGGDTADPVGFDEAATASASPSWVASRLAAVQARQPLQEALLAGRTRRRPPHAAPNR